MAGQDYFVALGNSMALKGFHTQLAMYKRTAVIKGGQMPIRRDS